ncbi:hypothetical protein GCM10023342_25120 [Modicisalibacter zincidurans]|uniref:Uncharacterized protein n=1 Tax=Modicisalibacter zincidurans TaxID=1178777 RepID=A0ABP9RHK7_9GAMM
MASDITPTKCIWRSHSRQPSRDGTVRLDNTRIIPARPSASMASSVVRPSAAILRKTARRKIVPGKAWLRFS